MSVAKLVEPTIQIGSEGERLSLGDFEVTFTIPGPGVHEGWMAADYTLPPRKTGAPLHYHCHLTESLYVISGEMWIRAGDVQTIAGPGSLILLPPRTLHSFANRSDSPVRFRACVSHASYKDFLRELFAMAQTEAVWPPKDPGKMAELGRRYDTFYLSDRWLNRALGPAC
jgi:mannose-6-phosphate isomerase-like protein (cupin superfamily)